MVPKPPHLPPEIVSRLEEYTDCYALFYFDTNGVPAFFTHIPTPKDKMALDQFIANYAENGLDMDGFVKDGENPDSSS